MRHAGKEPAGWGYSYADMSGGYSGALAVLMALWHRRRTGEGQFVDLSQFETISSVVGPSLLNITANQETIAPFGNRSQEAPAAPHGIYRCAGDDRWCAITVFTEEEWQAFCKVLGNPAWTQDARLTTLASRLENQNALDRHVEAWTRQHRPEAIMTQLQHAAVPAGVVANGEDLDRDPQLRARGYWATANSPDEGEAILDGTPVKLSATPGGVMAPGPLLGEQTDSVLQRLLAYSEEQIMQLKDAHVIASHAEIMAERS
jgi:crotonobetainyl-CoA:carnitine CoA-transferase CaiB-like acyl-CoA transferase